MTEQDKQLLFKDLCTRVPYRPFIELNPGSYNKPSVHRLTGVDEPYEVYLNIDSEPYNIEHIKPYLRPMSSMTEEEKEEVRQRFCYEWEESIMELYYSIEIRDIDCFIDWLNEHHFDYRGLIPMGLALEATEGMYKID